MVQRGDHGEATLLPEVPLTNRARVLKIKIKVPSENVTYLIELVDLLHSGLVLRRLFRHVDQSQRRVRLILEGALSRAQQVVSLPQQVPDPV